MGIGDVLIQGLASWRIASMLVSEYGPLGIFVRLRELAGITHDDTGVPSNWKEHNVLSCVWCTSVWVAVALSVLPKAVSHIGAAAAIAVLIDRNSK